MMISKVLAETFGLEIRGVDKAKARDTGMRWIDRVGLNGLGTARGTLMGIAAAELACRQTSDVTDFFLAEDDPVRLPPHPFDTIGANAYMRWKEWQARLE